MFISFLPRLIVPKNPQILRELVRKQIAEGKLAVRKHLVIRSQKRVLTYARIVKGVSLKGHFSQWRYRNE